MKVRSLNKWPNFLYFSILDDGWILAKILSFIHPDNFPTFVPEKLRRRERPVL